MEEPLTISKEVPEQKSMNYELLRQEGLNYVQNIAGKIWTDYNIHDPGITILEILCYAITDLGYRTSYDIKDIIAPDPTDTNAKEIHNFFTAAQILPNAPVTNYDYRKLMIDVEIHDPTDPGCEYAGVKNAWIEEALSSEVDIYVNKEKNKLDYKPVKADDKPLDIEILYHVLLEFDECEAYGDLNENTLFRNLTITEHPELEGLVIRVGVEFARWDNKMIDWEDDNSIRQGIHNIKLNFLNLNNNYSIEYELTIAKQVILSGTKASATGPEDIEDLEDITQKINQFIYGPEDGMINQYRKKIAKIGEIIGEVKAKLHANRNLCEDFLKFNALRIEEIILCADIELELDANVEETQAHIFNEISAFLSPTVYFYSLEEMMTRCFDQYQYDVVSINTEERVFTIDTLLDTLPEKGMPVTITGSNNNDGVYTVQKAGVNKNDETQSHIFVQQAIPSDILTEGGQLYLVNLEEDQCMPTEKIFEGPLLDHGFIDNEELARADRKKVIHVSDLIQIIMDVPGVVAVKNIQIANDPQGNDDGIIKTKSVKWCLDLAFEHNYVPRLNTEDSRITYYKDQLPFRADRLQVNEILEELEDAQRPQKLRNPVLDIEPPLGDYRDIEDYYSIQNEFPLVYGVGEEGVLPTGLNALNLPDEAHARQLKGFLMHLDQLLANYLSQLAHVKELFSMNPKKDEFGNFIIGRTYYTQTLFDIVPDVDALYLDKAGHETQLNNIAESDELFWERRNRFLNHLMARFAEQFTDYVLLTYRLSGPQSQNELIEDKLAFLNRYPEISSQRGTAFDYQSPCKLWHKDNVSGLEQRVSMLTGIEEQKVSQLVFSPRFKITGTPPDVGFVVENDTPEDVLKSSHSFETIDEAKTALEEVIVNGVHKHKYVIQSDDGTQFYFQLFCDDEVIAESIKTDFTTDSEGGDTDQAIDEVINLLTNEFYDNPEANRHNLACSLLPYFDYSIDVNMEPNPPTFTIEYQLYEVPFIFTGTDPVLTGSYTGQGEAKEDTRVLSVDTAASTFTVEGNIIENLAVDDIVTINGSDSNDGTYTVSSFTLNGDDTDIVVNEAIPSDAGARGNLLYNVVTEEEMQALAESAVHDVLWRVASAGVRRESYSFVSDASSYRFQIGDFRGNILGKSVASDFNESLADEIENVSTDTVTLIEPGADPNIYEYNINSATADGPNIEVEIDSAPSPVPSLDWQLKIEDLFPLKAIDQVGRAFTVEGDLSDRLSVGNSVTISYSSSNDGSYSIIKIAFDGTDTLIDVQKPVPSAVTEGLLSYTKIFSVIKTVGNVITIKGGGDEAAVQKMIEFLQIKFFSHEGIHLIEHILLRPKTNEPLFIQADGETLAEGLADNGKLKFYKQYPIESVNYIDSTFAVGGDITDDLTDLTADDKIIIQDSSVINGEFTVESFTFTDPNTEITVEEIFFADVVAPSELGTLSYPSEESISVIHAEDRQIIIPGNFAGVIAASSVVEITGSSDEKNDGLYIIQSVTDAGADTEIIIEKAEQLIQDRLLSINLDEKCECALKDPYTCMAHVIIPYWPGRFTNTDFRSFFEKTLRREAPAHVFLNICWVSCQHMDAFERACKAWLIENARPQINRVTLSKTLDELIESIEQLRNVYPEGKLHDCEKGESLENAIILNHSALGEI